MLRAAARSSCASTGPALRTPRRPFCAWPAARRRGVQLTTGMATGTTTAQITMPQMGESVTEGTVLEWRKQVGDAVEADEPLVEVTTDKVDTEIPAPASGTLTKVLVEP